MSEGIADLSTDVDTLIEDLEHVQDDIVDIRERVANIEGRLSPLSFPSGTSYTAEEEAALFEAVYY